MNNTEGYRLVNHIFDEVFKIFFYFIDIDYLCTLYSGKIVRNL